MEPGGYDGGRHDRHAGDIYNLQDDGQNVALMWEEASGVFSSRYVPGANTGRDAICESSRPHSKPVEGSLPAIVELSR